MKISESADKPNQKKLAFIIAGVVVLLLLAGGFYKVSTRWRIAQIQGEMAQSLVTPSPMVKPAVVIPNAAVKPQFSKPVIGMDYSDFSSLCGQADDSRSLETAKRMVTTYTYELSSERIENGCRGAFTFVDDRLNSIYRN